MRNSGGISRKIIEGERGKKGLLPNNGGKNKGTRAPIRRGATDPLYTPGKPIY